MAPRLRFALLFLLTFGLLASLVLVLHQSRQLAKYRWQHDQDQQSLRRAQDALRQQGLAQPRVAPEEGVLEEEQRAALAGRDATIERLTQELRETQSNVTALQGQLAGARDDRQKAQASTEERVRKQQADYQSKLDDLEKQLDAAIAGAEASRQRASALDAENNKLRADRHDDSARAAQVGSVIASLQDIDHRRDVYLTSIIRRYRDITNQFRATSGMLDSSHDPNSSALGSANLTRIQNAISQTDEDLRQLNELNDQAHLLEKKLGSK